MARKKSVEELDAELAQLEAELAALESGAALPAKKGKRKEEPAAEAAPEGEPGTPEAPAEPEAKALRSKLQLGRRRKGAEAPTEAPAAGGRAALLRKAKLPLGRKARAGERAPPEAPEEADPADEAKPRRAAPALPALGWQQEGRAWRARPEGPQRVEVVRRRLDEAGRVVEEEQVGEETVAPPPGEGEAPRKRRFGFGKAADAPPEEAVPAAAETGEPARPKRRALLAIPAVLLVAILVLAVVLPAVGIDPLGTGPLVGVGGGEPPVADVALSATTVAVNAPVSFDAGASRDPGGKALEYSWDFGDNSGDQGERVTHRYAAPGTYTVTLTARNSAGQEATKTAQVAVLPPPLARIAITLGGAAPGGENSPLTGDELTFDASGSTAEGGRIASYEWTFGDGARATGAQVAHAYSSPGAFRVALTVVDANGLRGNATSAVYVGQQGAFPGEAPATVQGAMGVNHTIAVVRGLGALPYAPSQLRLVLTFNGTVNGTGALPLPGGVSPETLGLTVYDAAGAIVDTLEAGPSPRELTITDFGGTLGAWNLEVTRPQGGAQAMPYTLQVRLLVGPA